MCNVPTVPACKRVFYGQIYTQFQHKLTSLLKIFLSTQRPKCNILSAYAQMQTLRSYVEQIILPIVHNARYYEHTLTVRCNSRPHSCSLTHTSAVSHQVVTWIATVVCCLSKCSSCMIDYAISWVFQSTTVHSCKMRYTLVHMCRVNDQHSYITNIQTIVNGK